MGLRVKNPPLRLSHPHRVRNLEEQLEEKSDELYHAKQQLADLQNEKAMQIKVHQQDEISSSSSSSNGDKQPVSKGVLIAPPDAYLHFVAQFLHEEIHGIRLERDDLQMQLRDAEDQLEQLKQQQEDIPLIEELEQSLSNISMEKESQDEVTLPPSQSLVPIKCFLGVIRCCL